MHHPVEHHVVGKDRFAEHLGRQIDARRVAADDAIVAHALGRRPPSGLAAEIHGRGERPIILAGRRAAMDDGAVAYREIRARIAEARRSIQRLLALLAAAKRKDSQASRPGACLLYV